MWCKWSVAILVELRSRFILIPYISRKNGKGHSHYVALTTTFLHLQYRKIVGFCRQTFWNLVHKTFAKSKTLQIFPSPCLLAHLKMRSEKLDRKEIISEEKWPYLWLLNRCDFFGAGGFMKIILSEILKIDVWSRRVSWVTTVYRRRKEIGRLSLLWLQFMLGNVFLGWSAKEKNDDKSWRIIRLWLLLQTEEKGWKSQSYRWGSGKVLHFHWFECCVQQCSPSH